MTVVDTYLNHKANDFKLTCLMSVLSKVNEEDIVVTDQADFTKKIKEGVQQGIDLNTLLLQYQYFKVPERDDITNCALDLERALVRCKAVYTECEEINYNLASGSDDPTRVN